jgi:hypothetical protein
MVRCVDSANDLESAPVSCDDTYYCTATKQLWSGIWKCFAGEHGLT